jgi:plastocyanin
MKFLRKARIAGCTAGLLLWPAGMTLRAQESSVSLQVEVVKADGAAKSGSKAKAGTGTNVAVWLTPVGAGTEDPGIKAVRKGLLVVQKNKSFQPHLTVVQVGAVVEFPNKDPFFHNVFSLFNGRRFDLGLYEAGSSNSVHFDRAGISYLFCNIHPEMSGVVVAVPTPYFGVSNGGGRVTIANVPSGRYRMHVWSERSSAEDLAKLEREVTISEASTVLEPVQVVESVVPGISHKNKYGKDYLPPSSPEYARP